MFRKSLFAVAVLVGFASIAATSSSAEAGHCHRGGYYGHSTHYHGGYGGYGYRGPVVVGGYYGGGYAPYHGGHYHGYHGQGYGYGHGHSHGGVSFSIGF